MKRYIGMTMVPYMQGEVEIIPVEGHPVVEMKHRSAENRKLSYKHLRTTEPDPMVDDPFNVIICENRSHRYV